MIRLMNSPALQQSLATANQKRIVSELERIVNDPALCPDGYLPPQRRLAEQLHISQPTLIKILMQLEQHGLIRRVAGGKRIIAGTGTSPPGLLGRTVILLVGFTNYVVDTNVPSGDLNAIHIGVTQTLQKINLNYLQIFVENVSDWYLNQLISARPEGFILRADTCPPDSDLGRIIRIIRQSGVPLVVYGYDDRYSAIPHVVSDHREGTYLLTKHLISLGRTRILRYWELKLHSGYYPQWLRNRDEGYEQAVTEAGLPLLPPHTCRSLPFYIETPEEFETRVQFTCGGLTTCEADFKTVDAIMALTDEQVFSLTSACRRLGRRVHEDIAITGYDNYWQCCKEMGFYNAMPLATVDKCNFRIGTRMTQKLLSMIEYPGVPVDCCEVVEPELIVCQANQSDSTT